MNRVETKTSHQMLNLLETLESNEHACMPLKFSLKFFAVKLLLLLKLR